MYVYLCIPSRWWMETGKIENLFLKFNTCRLRAFDWVIVGPLPLGRLGFHWKYTQALMGCLLVAWTDRSWCGSELIGWCWTGAYKLSSGNLRCRSDAPSFGTVFGIVLNSFWFFVICSISNADYEFRPLFPKCVCFFSECIKPFSSA